MALGASRDPRTLGPLFAAAQRHGETFYTMGRIGGPRAERFLLTRPPQSGPTCP